MRNKLPIVLNDQERRALLGIPRRRYITGHRNAVMLQIMFNTGLRLSEVINLRWNDIDFLSETLMVREGKGGKDRTLYIKDNNWRGENDKAALQEWKDRQAKKLGRLPDHVFTTLSANKSGEKLNPRYIQNMLSRYAERADLAKRISPHTCRHTFATDLYRLRKDSMTLKSALGHSHIGTTMIYVSIVSADVEAALSGINL